MTNSFIQNQSFPIAPESRRAAFLSYITNATDTTSAFQSLNGLLEQSTGTLKEDILFALGAIKNKIKEVRNRSA